MEVETRRFYEKAAARAEDARLRQLLDDLAQEERSHEDRAEELEKDKLAPDIKHKEDEASRRLFVLQIVQPGLAGLMDGSVSTLAPVFAAAFATQTVGMRLWSGWRHQSEPASAWASPRPCQTMAASPGAVIPGCGDLFAVS